MNSTTKDEAPGEAGPSSTEDLEFTDEALTDKEAEELLEEDEEEEAGEQGSEDQEIEKGPSLRERFRQADLVSKLHMPAPAKTGLILVCVFLVALFLRGYFGYGPATEHGVPFLYSGGSDSFYHQRAIEYGLEEHRHLRFDPLLNYPVGFSNPRPPFFDYSAVVFGEMLAPLFFGGDALHSASFVLIWITALFGALTVFPVYALAKQAFNRRVGLIAALLLAIMPAHIERSVITNADHDSTAIFFMITCFYFFLRALHFMKVEKWVGSWHRPGDIVSGVGRMVRENRMSAVYALLSGVAFAMVALTWQGYPYLLSVIVFYFFITLLMDKFRGVDPLSVTFITGIALFSGFIVAYPYYYFWGFIGQWYDTPFLIFLIAMAVGFAFCATRDYPWLFVFPAGILVGVGAFFLLSYVNPGFQNTVVSGQGYFFFRSKLYSTIAEAQPAQFSRMAVSFGMGAFLLALWGVAHVAANYRKNPRHDYLFVVAFAIVGMTFTISQGRFLTNGAPIIAILAAFVVDKIMGIARFEDIRTSYSSMRGTKVRAAVKSVKWKHAVIALGLAFLVVIPSLWFAVDAGIPNEEKREWDLQVYRAMPDVDIKWPGIIDTKFTLRPGTYDQENGSFHYFGAFGYSLPLPNQYYSDAYDWLSQQDADILEEGKRPAFISWWDYGFEAANRGDHPTVADNFQNGYQLAGSFLMAQNESEAMGLLVSRLLEGAYSKEGRLNPGIVAALQSRGVSSQKLEDILKNPASYVSIVLASPDRYGNFSKDLTTFNAKYAAMRSEITSKAKGEPLHELWRELRTLTGWDVKYFAVDSRLMVFGGQETGIFYAPAKLADKRMKGSDLTMPQDFFEIKAVSDVGTEYEPDEVPPGVNLNSQNPYKIAYKRPFYNSMLYRAFVGYGPQQVNRSEGNAGIPGLQGSGDMATLEPKQAHMMKHWRVAYKSAYWNPHDEKNVSKHQRDWEAVEWHVAQDRIKAKNGTVIQGTPDTTLWRQNGGVSILRYYDGAVLDGVVKTSSNRVVAGARVTATDEQNVPHDSVVTDKDGRFRLTLPFGNITVSASNGGTLDFVAMKEKTELGKMTLNVTLEEADRKPLDRNRDGTLDWQYAKDLIVKESTLKGRVFLDTDLSGAYSTADTLLKDQPFTVTGGGSSVPSRSDGKGDYLVARLSPGPHDVSLVYNGRPVEEKLFATVGPGETSSKDWLVKVGSVKGNISDLPADRGLQMRLVGDGRTVTTPIGQNGTSGGFEFRDLNPGIYTVQVDSPEFTVGVKRVTVRLGSATSVDLQTRAGVPLKVRVLTQTPDDGVIPAAFAQLALDRHETFAPSGRVGDAPVPVQLDANGEADLVVVPSTYSLSGQFSHHGSQFAGSMAVQAYGADGAEVRFTMTHAAKVTGRIMLGDQGETGQNIRVAFYSSDSGGRTSAITNATGHYAVWVPRGTYTLVAQEDRLTSGFVVLERRSVFGTVELGDVVAKNASIVHGFTYSDMNSDGRVDPGEERSGVRLLVRTEGLLFDSYSTLANGSFRVFLPKAKPAEAEVGGVGWVPITVPLEEGEQNIQVAETKAKLEGSVRYRDQIVTGDLHFRFSRSIGSGNNTTTEVVNVTATDGVLTGELLPGDWQMDLSQPINQVARWFASGGVEVNHGTARVDFDVQVSKLVNLSVSSDAPGQPVTLRLSGPQKYEANVTDKGTLEVEAGNYSAEASTASQKLFFARADLDEFRSNLSMKLETSALLDGKVSAPAPGSGVKILIGDATTGWSGTIESKAGGEYEVRLIAGREYAVSVDHIMNETIADTPVPVLLSFQGKVYVGKDTTFPIPASKTRLSVHVAGTASDLFGNPAGGARLLLSNAVISPLERIVLSNGRFDFDVPPGVYNLYATHVSQQVPQSLLTQVVVPAVKDHPLLLQMRYSVTFSGRVEFEQVPATARIRVSGGAVHEFVAAGGFSLLLPVGEYSLAAESKKQEWGMQVAYTASTSASLKESAYHVFDLKRADVMTAKLDWDKTQKQEIKQGERLRSPYVVTIENTGNIVDTWTFSGTLSEWNLTFSTDKVTLQPGTGDRTKIVFVSLQAPKDARVDHPAVTIEAKSEKGKQTTAATLEVDVTQVYGVELRKTASEFIGSDGRMTLRVENKGNGDDNYTVTVLNDEELASGGWKVGFTEGNETRRSTSRGVKISEGGADLSLALRPVGAPKKGVSIILEARSERGEAETRTILPLTLPDLTTGEIDVDGPEAKDAPFNPLTPWLPVIYVLAIIPISFILIYFFQRHGFRGLAAIIKWRVRRNFFSPRMRR